MYIASVIVAIIVVNLDLSAAAKKDDPLPSLCCITGDRRNYVINTTFLTADCKEKCVCTQDAFLACIPLCPQPIRSCPGHMIAVPVSQSITMNKKTCYCKKFKCVPPPGQAQGGMPYVCTDGNKKYKEGQTFVRNCNEKCRCRMNGQLDCVSLCPKTKPCMVDHTEKIVPIPIPYTNNKCQCSARSCKPDPYNNECDVNGKIYQTSDTFVSSDCSSSCTCLHGKIMCTSLCQPQGNNCKLGERAVQVQKKVPNHPSCSCPFYKCVVDSKVISVVGQIVTSNTKAKTPVVNVNQHRCTTAGGKVYPVGSVFSDNNCKSKCHCLQGQNNGPAVLSCQQPLCLPQTADSSCKKHKTVQVPTGLPDAQGKACTCANIQCV